MHSSTTKRAVTNLLSLTCLFLFCALVPSSADGQDAKPAVISGVWTATAETEDGEKTSKWTIVKSGGAYAGEYLSDDESEEREITNIALDGNKLSFDLAVDYEGQSMLIKVDSVVERRKLSGTWTVMKDGNELASGDLSAVKQARAKFSGQWNSVAALPDGNELEGLLSLKGKNKNLSGSFSSDGSETAIDEVTVKDGTLRMEFSLDIEGNSRDVAIEASMDSGKSLDGRWILLDDAGAEEATGDWIARRIVDSFDGSTMESFRGYAKEEVGAGWTMSDGVLHFDGKKSGDIVTKQEFANFELEFDWKISEAGNSGVMYRVSLGDQEPYFSGPEYQVLDDDKHKDGKLESHRAGSLYALYVPKNKTLKPVGEWNSSKIVLNGNTVEHWLNDIKVVEAELESDDWNDKVAASKFSNWEKFGKNKKGHIVFQDHGDEVWYRNIRINPLD